MKIEKKRTGRPAKRPSAKSFKDNEIHALLVEKMPAPYVRDEPFGNESVLDTLRIAKDIGVSRYTVYRFLNDEKLSKRTAAGLKRISKGNLTDSDLLPYLMRL